MFRKKAGGLLLSFALLLIIISAIFSPVAPAASARTTFANAQLIFSLKQSGDLSEVVTTFSFKSYKALRLSGVYLATLLDNSDVETVVAQMNRDKRVKFAEPNYAIQYVENANNFAFDGGEWKIDPKSLIKGTLLSTFSAKNTAKNQWAWQKTNLAGGWKFTQGKGVTVAVLDSGVNYNLPDFDNKVRRGWSALDGGDGMDDNGHGTFVAGIIHQVAPDAHILPVKVLDKNGTGTVDSIAEGAYWAYDRGAKVINLSFSAAEYSETLKQLITDLTSKDVVVVASSGNNNSQENIYPASYKPVIAVGATNSQDTKTDFSNFGSYIDLSAPGEDIYSTYWKGGYAWSEGTSFSAPMVAGAAVLYRAYYPLYNAHEVVTDLKDGVDKFSSNCFVQDKPCSAVLGQGRLNFARVLKAGRN
ncbi:MAG TPA: S8 family serine peptidase [Chloroflexia bacterium]|nr:S8 family serine peptidase [Chloroflexia bacterium]